MHAFVRKGLLLSAATGTLVMGYAGTAAAQGEGDSAVTQGAAGDSPGAVSGNVAQVPADVPIQVCGDAGAGGAALVGSRDNDCVDEGTHAVAKGAAADSPGLASGNVLQLAADAPVQACGDAVALLGFDVSAKDNHCVNGAPEMAPPPMPSPPVSCPPPPPNPCPPQDDARWSQASDNGDSWIPSMA